MKTICHPWVSREETLRLILERSQFQPRIEKIPVRYALERVTAEETLAVNTLPNGPTSRLDGIAIKSASLSGGIPNTGSWKEGVDYVFSNTGVGLPDDYDTVVLIEDVKFDETGKLRIARVPAAGQNVWAKGSDMCAGELLVPANFKLGPAQMGLLTAGGVTEVAVLEKPRVAILPTGNELVPAGCKPPRGKNVEYNGAMMEAHVKTMGAEPRLYPITRDNPDDLIRVINGALAWADIVILNGGSSKGTDDRAIEVLESIGEILVYGVDYGPGRHTTMTIAGTKPIVGAVGPAIGAEYAIEWYVLPLVNKYLSLPTIAPRRLRVKLLNDIHAPMSFDYYKRLSVQEVDEAYVVKQIGASSSSLVMQMMANALLHIPKEIKGYNAGDIVEVELRCPLELVNQSASQQVDESISTG